ncbi:MAG: YciI family protein [Saprospiraceae bacterium]|nr:YciI family protein [Saprospiraceae bacterium]
MTEYILLFRNASAENGYLTTSQDMAEDMPKWQSWIGNIAMQGKLVSTAPIRYDASIVDDNGVSSNGQPYKEVNGVLVSGYLICKADTLEEVQEWSKSCPILKYPNSSVEIRPLIPFPTN